jgi:hypothetical protein
MRQDDEITAGSAHLPKPASSYTLASLLAIQLKDHHIPGAIGQQVTTTC